MVAVLMPQITQDGQLLHQALFILWAIDEVARVKRNQQELLSFKVM